MDDILTLVAVTQTQNEYGVWVETPVSSKDVFCKCGSITRAEFFEAGRNGLNPSFTFTVFFGDYNGEETCWYHGKQYGIYRTYIVPGTDYLELYVERKGGTNAEASTD